MADIKDNKDKKSEAARLKDCDTENPRKYKSDDPNETFGYEFFPARDGQSTSTSSKQTERGWLKSAWDIAVGRDAKRFLQSSKCQSRVIKCVEENYMVKLLVSALKSKGCEFKLSRHVSCEECGSFANGGYDGINRQVVVCSNNSVRQHTVCNVLSHELIHAFDDCRAKMDLSNIDHLACTEIRAANLMHCTMTSSMFESSAKSWGKGQQQECVRWKARNSILSVRNVSVDEANEAIDRVFDKCYPDLEPVGRIPRNPHVDGRRMYVEASLYGYTEEPNIYKQHTKR